MKKLWQVTTYNLNGMPHCTLFMREDNARAYAERFKNDIMPVEVGLVLDIWGATAYRHYAEAEYLDAEKIRWIYKDVPLCFDGIAE